MEGLLGEFAGLDSNRTAVGKLDGFLDGVHTVCSKMFFSSINRAKIRKKLVLANLVKSTVATSPRSDGRFVIML